MTESNPQKTNLDRTLREIAKFQFVLSEGKKGNHLLFHADTIRETFAKDQKELSVMFQSRLDEINNALNQTFQIDTFEEKRKFILSLSGEIQQAMIFGYFQLLDGLEPEAGQPASVH